MPRRRVRLEDLILAALERAIAEGRTDVAEHLLCALEACDACCAPGTPLGRAYLSALGPAVVDVGRRPGHGGAARAPQAERRRRRQD
jgi:hypothetical protein